MQIVKDNSHLTLKNMGGGQWGLIKVDPTYTPPWGQVVSKSTIWVNEEIYAPLVWSWLLERKDEPLQVVINPPTRGFSGCKVPSGTSHSAPSLSSFPHRNCAFRPLSSPCGEEN